MSKRWGTGRFVNPAVREVDEIVEQVPCGRLITIKWNLRQTVCCG